MQFGPAACTEEIETWKDVYGIEERYKAKLCGENDGKYWLTQVLDECQDDDKQPISARHWLCVPSRRRADRMLTAISFESRFLRPANRLEFFENSRSNLRQCS